jgi:hypothetical protein
VSLKSINNLGFVMQTDRVSSEAGSEYLGCVDVDDICASVRSEKESDSRLETAIYAIYLSMAL